MPQCKIKMEASAPVIVVPDAVRPSACSESWGPWLDDAPHALRTMGIGYALRIRDDQPKSSAPPAPNRDRAGGA